MNENIDNEKIYVTKSFLPPINEYIKEIEPIWNSNWMTNNGAIHEELNKNIKEYLSVSNSTLFCNGHLALDIAIKGLELKGEVITTPFTFASTTHAIVMNNLIPVFCDIKMDDFNIDENKIEDLITEKTSAIVAVNVFGQPCNLDKIKEIADKYNLKVIYDSAHAFGVKVYGNGIGNYGDVSMFSMHATKVYNSIEGGILTYSEEGYRKKFNMLKNFGITSEEDVEYIGLNAKMNEFQAAMGVVNLRYVDEEIRKRKRIYNLYKEKLKDISGIYIMQEKEGIEYNYSYFPIIIDEKVTNITRDELYEKLKDFDIFARKYFYPLVTKYKCYEHMNWNYELSNAEYISNRILTLPMYGQLKAVEVERIVATMKKILGDF